MGSLKMHEIIDQINEMFQENQVPSGKQFMLLLDQIDPKIDYKIYDPDKNEFVDDWQYRVKNVYTEEAIKYFNIKKRSMKKKEGTAQKPFARLDADTKKVYFIACKNKEMRTVLDEITVSEARNIMILLSCMTMKSKGKLVDERGKALTKADICELLELSAKQFERFSKKMKELKIIETQKHPEDKRKEMYFVNKRFHSMNETLNSSFTKLYKERLKEIACNKEIGNALGALYKIVPYIQYQTGYVCWNPDHDIRSDKNKTVIDCLHEEKTIYAIDHMLQKDIAAIVGVTESTMNRYIGIYEEMCIMKRDMQGDSVLHLVDPSFIYRQDWLGENADDSFLKVISFQFAQHKRYKNGFRKKSNRGRKK